jgi:thiol:disulfide interchange protein
MEHTTFKSREVQRRLGTCLQVRFQAEHLNEPGTRQVLDYFGAFGLPTYVILRPRGAGPTESPGTKVASLNSSREMARAGDSAP